MSIQNVLIYGLVALLVASLHHLWRIMTRKRIENSAKIRQIAKRIDKLHTQIRKQKEIANEIVKELIEMERNQNE